VHVPNIGEVLEVWMLMKKGSEPLLHNFLSPNVFFVRFEAGIACNSRI